MITYNCPAKTILYFKKIGKYSVGFILCIILSISLGGCIDSGENQTKEKKETTLKTGVTPSVGTELSNKTEEATTEKKETEEVNSTQYKNKTHSQSNKAPTHTIEIAILLDTSNSMDGLIDQTKAQLWKMISDLGKTRAPNGSIPRLKLAIYEYGNDTISFTDNYVREVMPFTTDLDMISGKLFSLTTHGGSEYAGAVIGQAVEKLDWSREEKNVRIIFIAGNEEFNQGNIPYQTSIQKAREKNILVNTIFCGDFQEGKTTFWEDGALLGNGKYFTINQDKQVVHVTTPQDKKIGELNSQLNSTYLPYGSKGKERAVLQAEQDKNAAGYGKENLSLRVQSKISSNYVNVDWDLVDAFQEGSLDIDSLKDEELPERMQNLSSEEQKKYIQDMLEKRKKIQKEIQILSEERAQYILKQKKITSIEEDTLDTVIFQALRQQLENNNFSLGN